MPQRDALKQPAAGDIYFIAKQDGCDPDAFAVEAVHDDAELGRVVDIASTSSGSVMMPLDDFLAVIARFNAQVLHTEE